MDLNVLSRQDECAKFSFQTKKATKVSSRKIKALKKSSASITVQPKSTESKELNKEHKNAGKHVKDLITNEKHLLPHSLDCVLVFRSVFLFLFFLKSIFCAIIHNSWNHFVCICACMCVCIGQKNITNLKRKRMGTGFGTWL